MPCYDPPEDKSAYLPGSATMKKYVATLNEIEETCRAALGRMSHGRGENLPQHILDIIDAHWGKKA